MEKLVLEDGRSEMLVVGFTAASRHGRLHERDAKARELSAICKLAHEICGPRFFPF